MKYWIWLSSIPYIGPVTANRLLEHFGHPARVYHADISELIMVKDITNKQVKSIADNKSLNEICKIMETCHRKGISILQKNDVRYPEQAKILKDAPIVLYYKGHFQDMKDSVAIVGARRCTQEAKFQTVTLAEKYAGRGQAIISGMAKGIDSYAHTACLKVDGYTVAVVGNGLDICYPSEHKKLMDCIAEKGLLLSEYPPGISPTRYTFLRRNRLISAWANHIIVIAPGKGSGALVTAEYGKKYDRQVEILS